MTTHAYYNCWLEGEKPENGDKVLCRYAEDAAEEFCKNTYDGGGHDWMPTDNEKTVVCVQKEGRKTIYRYNFSIDWDPCFYVSKAKQ